MTHAIALNGQWEGLRAFPRATQTPDRKRLEGGLSRLGSLYEQMAARAALLHAGMERLNNLRADLIDQLDATEADADLEADGSDEPSLCGLGCNCVIGGGSDDREDQCEDEGGQCEDEGADESDDDGADYEPSLTTLMASPVDQSGSRWVGSFDARDLEDDADAEPSLCGVGMSINSARGTYHNGSLHYDLEAAG
jgi:hypothetical protein